jgi:hypothetical protein
MKVWNTTDHPASKTKPHKRMILGHSVAPGRSIEVDDKVLEGATKLKKEAAAGLVFIGDKLPAAYKAKKPKPKPRMARGAARAHGTQATPIKKAASAPAPAQKPAESKKKDEGKKGYEVPSSSKGKSGKK